VRFFRAAACAFLTFRFAASVCFFVATSSSVLASHLLVLPASSSRDTPRRNGSHRAALGTIRIVGDFGLYLAFLIPPLVIGLAVQAWLKRTFARYSQVELATGLSGAQVARTILDRNGLDGVPVQHASGGALTDHYDPRKRALFLSPPVYEPPSVAAAAVAAHETGHALQHASAYVPLRIRSAMFPAVAFASSAWMWLLLIGALLGALNLVAVALLLYAVAVAFHLVTLPVEFNASRRASNQLRELGLVAAGEQAGVQKVLNAAAMTYVAGALAALTQLLYFLLVFFGDRE
jgi:Zn-dependent membrane protease YugP